MALRSGLINHILDCARSFDVELDLNLLQQKANDRDVQYFELNATRCAIWSLKPHQGEKRKLFNYYNELIEKHERLLIERAVRICKRK